MPEYGGYEQEATPTTDAATTTSLPDELDTAETSPAPLIDHPTQAPMPELMMTPTHTPNATVTPAPTPTPTPSPTTTLEPSRDKCYYERDLGIIERASASSHVFCANTSQQAGDRSHTQVTLVDAPSRLRAVVFRGGLELDLTRAMVHRPIYSIAQDGGAHDPRFRFSKQMVRCSCEEFYAFATVNGSENSTQWNVWDPALAFQVPWDKQDSSLFCRGDNSIPSSESTHRPIEMEFTDRVLLVPRRDDHNPFFQVSAALNAWIMMRALQWDPMNVTLIHFDDGYPSSVDELHQKLLSPGRTVIGGRELIGKRLRFSDEVMLAPFETSGPMMQHLDDVEPCYQSELYRIFREKSLEVMSVAPTPHDRIVVTIISRKPYSGRMVQRRWLNEDDIVAKLRTEYSSFGDKPVAFQNVDFAELPFQRQMQFMLDSDVVIGMHGAGMVNVLWTRPGTLVIEIFPLRRKRWGFRNLCQHTGCVWHEFRGGKDTGMADNASDKFIPYGDWRAFFDPLFRSHVAKTTAEVH